MDLNEFEMVELPSGFKVPMSTYVYDNHFCDFTETQYLIFNNYINAGIYFPQMIQFAFVLRAIIEGHTGFRDIVFGGLIAGVAFMLLWYWMRYCTIPHLSFFICLIGGNIFRLNLHFIVIIIVAIFVAKDWKVILFCLIGGVISSIVRALLFGRLTSVKYVDRVVKFISNFRYKG